MSPVLTAVFILCMFVNAAVFSMLGQGGGVLYTPIQVFFGIGFHEAATTSLFLIIITSLSSTLVFHRSGKVDWPLALVLETATVAGAFCGGLYSGHLSAHVLTIVFALLVALAGALMRGEGEQMRRAVRHERLSMFDWRREVDGNSYSVNLALALPISFLAGAFSGLVGLAGGILKIPMLVLLFGVPMDIAVASSAFMVGLTALGGFAGHLAVGHWDWRTTLLLALPVFLGGQIGARRSLQLKETSLKKIYVWFLFCIAVLMFSRIFWTE